MEKPRLSGGEVVRNEPREQHSRLYPSQFEMDYRTMPPARVASAQPGTGTRRTNLAAHFSRPAKATSLQHHLGRSTQDEIGPPRGNPFKSTSSPAGKWVEFAHHEAALSSSSDRP